MDSRILCKLVWSTRNSIHFPFFIGNLYISGVYTNVGLYIRKFKIFDIDSLLNYYRSSGNSHEKHLFIQSHLVWGSKKKFDEFPNVAEQICCSKWLIEVVVIGI